MKCRKCIREAKDKKGNSMAGRANDNKKEFKYIGNKRNPWTSIGPLLDGDVGRYIYYTHIVIHISM